MPKPVSDELGNAFFQLHDKVVDTRQKVKLADMEIEKLKRSRQRSELTIKEIASHPANTKTYESVGRMFMLDDVQTIKSGLEQRIKTADEKVKALEDNKRFLEQDLQECKRNIGQMIKREREFESSDDVAEY